MPRVAMVTRGMPIFYGTLARRLVVLSRRRGYRVIVPASASISEIFTAASAPPRGRLALQVRDGSCLRGLDVKTGLIVYNLAGGPDTLAALRAAYPPEHEVFVLPGSGDREFSPSSIPLREADALLSAADEAATLYLPPQENAE